MRVGAIQQRGRDAGALADRGAYFIDEFEVHPNQVETNDGDALRAVIQDHRPRVKIIMNAGASLDRSQRRTPDRRSNNRFGSSNSQQGLLSCRFIWMRRGY